MAKILLVEDDKSLREIYGVRLQAEGYTITSAGDGEEALAVAIKERPDLIVSDVMMPKISGFDMLDILRSTTETKAIKVIMMTALSSEDQRARGEALGADRYLVKSQVGIEDVVRTVHDVLGDAPTSSAAPAFAPAPATAPVIAPQPVAAPMPVAPTPAPTMQPAPAPYVAPQPAPAPIQAPQVAPTPLIAPVVEPAPAPVFTQPVAPAPVAPQPVTPSTPAPAPYVAPQPVAAPAAPFPAAPAPAPTPFGPAPAAAPAVNPFTPAAPSILPQPTAPFSSDPPASLADRIINPLPSADTLNQNVSDIANQMNQELNAHLQQLDQTPPPVQTPTAPVAPPAPQPFAQPPVPPASPFPPQQPGV